MSPYVIILNIKLEARCEVFGEHSVHLTVSHFKRTTMDMNSKREHDFFFSPFGLPIQPMEAGFNIKEEILWNLESMVDMEKSQQDSVATALIFTILFPMRLLPLTLRIVI